MPKRKLRADQRITLTMTLLEALSAADDQTVSASTFAHEHGIAVADVCDLAALAATLADRNSGTRAIVAMEGDRIRLEGTAAQLNPTRLSVAEATVLAYTLNLLELDDDCKERIQFALMPFGVDTVAAAQLASSVSAGTTYQTLSNAVTDGVRCTIAYRSVQDTEPRERTIDPLSLEATDDAIYLLAWDIDADAERRYRLDRIASVRTTDDSVVAHQCAAASLAGSLSEHGDLIQLRMPVDIARDLPWKGIVSHTDDDDALLTVAVTSRAWLFDQLLSLGGMATIENNRELQEEFTAYARSLKIS